jgi:hypothetical protein
VTRAFLRRAALAHAAVSKPSSGCLKSILQCVNANASLRPTVSPASSGMRQLPVRNTSIPCPSRKVLFSGFPFRLKSTTAWSATM